MKPTHFFIFPIIDGKPGRTKICSGKIEGLADAKDNLRPGTYRIEERDENWTLSRTKFVVEKEPAPEPKPVPVVAAPREIPQLPPPPEPPKHPLITRLKLSSPASMTVLESLLQECHDGLQEHSGRISRIRSALELFDQCAQSYLFESHVLAKKPNTPMIPSVKREEVSEALQMLLDEMAAIPRLTTPNATVTVVPVPAPTPVQISSDEAPFKAPLLKAESQTRPVLIVGGIESPEITTWFRNQLGGHVLWQSVHKGSGPTVVDPLVKKVVHRKVSTVIALEEFLPHGIGRELQGAARIASIPYVFGGRAGRGRLRIAVEQAERMLQTQQKKVERG